VSTLACAQTNPLWVSEVSNQPDFPVARYLGSPSLVRLPDGSILASHDYAGTGTTSNETSVFKSTDNGNTWTFLKTLKSMFWATLFYHNNNVYLLGTSAGVTYRSIVIMKSADGGVNWTTPTSSTTGILYDKITESNPLYHCAPTPVVYHNGRLYKGFERLVNASQSFRGYSAFVISISENENDLLNAANWRKSTEVPYNTSSDLPGSVWNTGWIEGNVVEAPDGSLVNVIRVNSAPYVDKAAIIRISDDGNTAAFSASDFIKLPGGMSKFTIRRDPVSKIYFLFTNNNTDPNYPEQRNILSMYISSNLRDWYHAKTLMEDNLGLSHEESIEKTGFQYPDFQFDGDDIIYLVRTAYQGRNNFHNANKITFGRVENFRQYLVEEIQPAQTVGSTGRIIVNYNNAPEIYATVRAEDGNVWLQQNLGAKRLPTSRTDAEGYGDLFAWGRWDDGHQLRDATLANAILSPNNPSALNKTGSNPFYYYASASGYFWSGGLVTDKLSGDLTKVNANTGCDPCSKLLGADWSMPTKAEWENLLSEESITDFATAYSSNLKIPSAGLRNVANGTLGSLGTLARYWTADANASGQAHVVSISNVTATTLPVSRGGGISVRCVRIQRMLPVELMDFSGAYQQGKVQMQWNIASQTNNRHYTIRKSENANDFLTLATIQNIDDAEKVYHYTDYNPFAGYNYYKLFQTDLDGTTKELKTIAVYAGLNTEYLQIYKNAEGNLSIKLNHPISKSAELKLLTVEGRVIHQQQISIAEKVAVLSKNSISSGIYIIQVVFDNNETVSKKIIY